jgi:hypothetical protein
MAVQLKILTLGSILVFHSLPTLNGVKELWNCVLYAEAEEYMPSAVYFHTTESVAVALRLTLASSPHSLMYSRSSSLVDRWRESSCYYLIP